MKKILTLLLIFAWAIMPLSARQKHQWTIVERPVSAYSYGEGIHASQVEYCDTCTRVTLRVNARIDWSLAPTTRIVAGDKVLPVRRGTALQMTMSQEGVRCDTTHYRAPFEFGAYYYNTTAFLYVDVSKIDRATYGVVLEFPPLPKGTTAFDIDEGLEPTAENAANQCRLTGIRLDGKAYPAPLSGKQDAATPFRWTASTSSESRDARVRVVVIGEHLPANLAINPRFISMDNDDPLLSSLAETKWETATDGTLGGTATFKFAVPTLVYIHLGESRRNIYAAVAVPGEETILTVDYNTLHAANLDPQKEQPMFWNLSYSDGRDYSLLLPDGTTGDEKRMFREDLMERATNPEVAALRLKERTDAAGVIERCAKLEEVTEAEVAAVAAPYREVVRGKWKEACELRKKMQENKGGQICEVPDVAPADMIKAIVARYKGKAVFIDLWATWCGPCCQGIRAMKPHHDDFSPEDVQFVYLTDESSPIGKWNAMRLDMPGHHYRLKSMRGLEPAITGIPRYLIFDREGNLSCDTSGFGPNTANELCNEIRKAIGE